MSEATGTTVETTATTEPTAQELAAELAKARDALKAANKEAADRRKKLDSYEVAEKERKEAELSEIDKLNKRLADAEAAKQAALTLANDRLIKSAFISAAAKVGAEFPDDAYLLADRSNVTIDDNGNVSGVAEAVKALVDGRRIPLASRTAPSLNNGAGGGSTQTRSTQLSEAELAVARRMGVKPEDYAAHKPKR